MEDMEGGWKKFYSQELHRLYYSRNIISVPKLRRMEIAGWITSMAREVNSCRCLVGKLEENRPL
jgi:hypothetical protein